MDLEQELANHAELKQCLKEALSRQNSLDADTVSRDDRCELGQWLHSHAKGAYGGLGILQTCISRHAMLHREAGQIARLINQRRFQDAARALDDDALDVAISAAASSIHLLRQAIGEDKPESA
jgi:methyl-accepting chemotaxis protein